LDNKNLQGCGCTVEPKHYRIINGEWQFFSCPTW
jgi:hypothetical protein